MTQDNNSARVELLPCPFCGSQPSTPYEERGHRNDGWWHVACTGCDVQIGGLMTKEQAIAAWNTRPPQPPESGSLREALDKITEMLDLGRAEQEIITTVIRDVIRFADQSATQGEAAGEDDVLCARLRNGNKHWALMVADALEGADRIATLTAERDALRGEIDRARECANGEAQLASDTLVQLTTAQQAITTLEADKLGMHDLIEHQRQSIAKFPEIVARAIYEQWRDRRGFVPWVLGGNSDVQHEARRIARQHIDAAIALTETKP